MESASENKPYTIVVEGNIGSGKSTFLQYFNGFEDIEIIPEPVELFQDLNGTNLLDLVYKETKKWAFPFQSYVHHLMLQNYLKPTGKKVKVMERSIFSARNIFIELLKQNEQIEEPEYDILQKWYEFTVQHFAVKPDLIVYLKVEPDHAFARINKRGRFEENNIQFDYIKQIHELHEN